MAIDYRLISLSGDNFYNADRINQMWNKEIIEPIQEFLNA